MTALAGLAGGIAIGGVALLLLELTRQAPPPGIPPRSPIKIDRQARQRALIALIVGLATLAITRWPVAMIAAVLAVLFLPRLTSSGAAQRRAGVLEGLEQWTRRLSDMLTASRGLEDALGRVCAARPGGYRACGQRARPTPGSARRDRGSVARVRRGHRRPGG